MSVTHLLSSAVVGPTTTQSIESTPPITQILPFISRTVSIAVAIASKVNFALVVLTSWLSYPAFLLAKAPIVLILYVLSPFIIFGQIVLGVFVTTPYQYLVDFFVTMQPLYVFCGVACISGAIVGLGGRFIAGALTAAVMGPEQEERRWLEQASWGERPKKRVRS